MYGLNLDLKKKLEVGPVPLKVLAGATSRTNVWRTNEGPFQQFQYVGPTRRPDADRSRRPSSLDAELQVPASSASMPAI